MTVVSSVDLVRRSAPSQVGPDARNNPPVREAAAERTAHVVCGQALRHPQGTTSQPPALRQAQGTTSQPLALPAQGTRAHARSAGTGPVPGKVAPSRPRAADATLRAAHSDRAGCDFPETSGLTRGT